MSAFIVAVDGSHLSTKHKTFDLLCATGAQPCQLIVSLFFRNISGHGRGLMLRNFYFR